MEKVSFGNEERLRKFTVRIETLSLQSHNFIWIGFPLTINFYNWHWICLNGKWNRGQRILYNVNRKRNRNRNSRENNPTYLFFFFALNANPVVEQRTESFVWRKQLNRANALNWFHFIVTPFTTFSTFWF